ncbi:MULTISPECIES: GntR family transcriptional regulator [Metabacillus]|uniref:GntR family transcriptional regulator n=2 Tax=Metabacillus TaxID=2675233 RepID=A0A179SZS9_9BACI|nr:MULTISPECIES: GntR family transcriptional regulator [Metabacillus]OAS86758.1 GntR family transcriptional regulator [Metabacillus litoralis]QNF29170.1 GntR family transcriptional regulator [Metabacillus sp. KUDC1714]
MNRSLNLERPIFQQIAEKIEESILNGSLTEGDKAPSTNEIASFYQINPATAAKGINQLVEQEILYKKRGIGMFVSTGARDLLVNRRKQEFYDSFIIPLKQEAQNLNITKDELIELIEKEARS